MSDIKRYKVFISKYQVKHFFCAQVVSTDNILLPKEKQLNGVSIYFEL